jgi:hypothetical protein
MENQNRHRVRSQTRTNPAVAGFARSVEKGISSTMGSSIWCVTNALTRLAEASPDSRSAGPVRNRAPEYRSPTHCASQMLQMKLQP